LFLYTISNLYDVSPTLFGVTNNIVTSAANYGNIKSYYNGLELSVSARIKGGLQLQAGSSTGSQVQDSCEVRSQLPEISATNSPITGGITFGPLIPYCHVAPGMTTRVTALGSYTIPKADVQVSGTLASTPASLSPRTTRTPGPKPRRSSAVMRRGARPSSRSTWRRRARSGAIG
jgi:hypothetical protein